MREELEVGLSPRQRPANDALPPRPPPPSTAGLPPRPRGFGPAGRAQRKTYIFAVFRLGEVDQVIVVHVLGVEQVAILLLAEIFGVNPVGPEEFLVRHAECLPDGLCDQLGLDGSGRGRTQVNRRALLAQVPGSLQDLEPQASAGPVDRHAALIPARGGSRDD